MVKLLINPFTYVTNLSVLITCWVFIKFAIGQAAPIWLDKIMLVIICLFLLLWLGRSFCGKIFLLRLSSANDFKERKIIDDLVYAICDRNPIQSFDHLKIPNYQFRKLFLKNLDISIRRKIEFFEMNEIPHLTNKITSALVFTPEIDLKEKLLDMINFILQSSQSELKYESCKNSIEMLKDFVIIQIRNPIEKRQNAVIKIIEVLKFLKFEEEDKKWKFENWQHQLVNFINMILEPFELTNDKTIIVKDNMKAKLDKEIIHMSDAYIEQRGAEENYTNLQRLKQIKEKLAEY